MSADQPTHRLVQLSDLHLTAGGAPLYGGVDTEAKLRMAFDRIAATGLRFDAVIVSGDLADDGAADVYRRLRRIVDDQEEALGCPILVGAGNHDLRPQLNAAFGDPQALDAPLDSVTQVRGLRIVQLDSSVPGAGHGELSRRQLDWLAEELSAPAPHGTVLVVHHPPVPTSSEVMAMVALRNPEDLADALVAGDVRIILSGHTHTPGQSMLAGIPVAISGALSYAADPLYGHLGYRGMTEGQSFNLVEIFEQQVVTTVVPLLAHPTLHKITAADLARLLGG